MSGTRSARLYSLFFALIIFFFLTGSSSFTWLVIWVFREREYSVVLTFFLFFSSTSPIIPVMQLFFLPASPHSRNTSLLQSLVYAASFLACTLDVLHSACRLGTLLFFPLFLWFVKNNLRFRSFFFLFVLDVFSASETDSGEYLSTGVREGESFRMDGKETGLGTGDGWGSDEEGDTLSSGGELYIINGPSRQPIGAFCSVSAHVSDVCMEQSLQHLARGRCDRHLARSHISTARCNIFHATGSQPLFSVLYGADR